jgi:hypothetical protein
MTSSTWNTRSFKAGAWDLRKDERRKEEVEIAFPERRKSKRRNAPQENPHSTSSVGLLNWVNRFDVDE